MRRTRALQKARLVRVRAEPAALLREGAGDRLDREIVATVVHIGVIFDSDRTKRRSGARSVGVAGDARHEGCSASRRSGERDLALAADHLTGWVTVEQRATRPQTHQQGREIDFQADAALAAGRANPRAVAQHPADRRAPVLPRVAVAVRPMAHAGQLRGGPARVQGRCSLSVHVCWG